MENIIKKAEEFALSETKKYGSPPKRFLNTSNNKGEKLTKDLNADTDVVKKGIYLLVIKNKKTRKIKVGSLGQLNFDSGFFVYAGSAQNNLEKRVKRHKSKSKKLHWHIDYILDKMNITSVFKFKSKYECTLAKQIKLLSNSFVKGFGCSDCGCESHLFYFKKSPTSLLKKKESQLSQILKQKN